MEMDPIALEQKINNQNVHHAKWPLSRINKMLFSESGSKSSKGYLIVTFSFCFP